MTVGNRTSSAPLLLASNHSILARLTRPRLSRRGLLWGACVALLALIGARPLIADEPVRIGVIGLDTSHSLAFTEIFNGENPAEDVAGFRVTVAYPYGSADIESSASRIPGYTEQIKAMGVEIAESIPELLEKCDCVLLETNDGRLHLEQYRLIAATKKPCFIDKPLAASLADIVAIYDVAAAHDAPVFSCSSLRFSSGPQAARNGEAGDVLGCEAYSPCSLEATHPSLYWYGIHGVEILYTVMGAGCETVSRAHSDDFDFATGVWSDGRIGTFRGIRKGKAGYGGVVYGSNEIRSLGNFDGYRPLVVEIARFFRSGEAPIEPAETIELYAFMTAADESLARNGAPVAIAEVLEAARQEAASR